MTARAPLQAGSQCSRILARLVSHGSVTTLYAIHRMKILRPAARIETLRKRLHRIDTVMIGSGAKTAKYVLRGR
jgi:hypothetical protein